MVRVVLRQGDYGIMVEWSGPAKRDLKQRYRLTENGRALQKLLKETIQAKI